MSRALLRGVQCHACRYDVLQSFVAGSGVSLPRLATRIQRLPRSPPALQHSRHFSPVPIRSLGHQEDPSPENRDASETSGSNESEPTATYVPWYLQEQTPETAPTPFGQRQEIPPLPNNPPPILEGLLKHISVEIGLDNLALLDLRGLEPPPALGANLIMIIGSARSTKHLNVSADRLCRWLRSTYKLRPEADGLLGRNELKIKLRRKARKAKLAKNMGKTEETAIDDGITTGWICVNVGTVKAGEREPDASVSVKPKVAGFGTTEVGPRIVVQMMTEEKRAEVDLDGLWNGILRRESEGDERAKAELLKLGEEKDENAEPGSTTTIKPAPATYRTKIGVNTEQRRGICSSRRLYSAHAGVTADSSAQGIDPPISLDPFSGDLDKSGGETSSDPGKSATASTMSPLFDFLLNACSREEAHRELGRGVDDRSSTSFLRWFYQTIAGLSHRDFAYYRLMLVQAALKLQHPHYSKTDLFEMFQELAAFDFNISRDEAIKVFYMLLSHGGAGSESTLEDICVPTHDIDLALRVLENMSLRGMDILTNKILLSLYKAVGFQEQVHVVSKEIAGTSEAENAFPVSKTELQDVKERQSRLEKVMKALQLTFDGSDTRTLLSLYFNHEDFDIFWQTWRTMPLVGLSRTHDDYLFLFTAHAERGNQRMAADCLSQWFPMMEREEPPISLTKELARAVLQCVLIADPEIEQRVAKDKPGPLVDIWKQCADVYVG